jgi:hypothetical protein
MIVFSIRYKMIGVACMKYSCLGGPEARVLVTGSTAEDLPSRAIDSLVESYCSSDALGWMHNGMGWKR